MCVVLGSIGHLQVFVDVAGAGAATFLRRQSEAYAMIALVVVFWAAFARGGHPAAEPTLEDRNPPTSYAVWLGWFVALLAFSIAMVAWDTAPGPFATQKEALVGVALITWYLAWSRGLRPKDAQWRNGLPIRSLLQRYRYYVVVLWIIAIAYTSFPADMMGEGLAVWLTEGNEGYVAALLIPAYFDLFSRSRGPLVTIGWYAFLVITPIAVRMDDFPEALSSQVAWFEEVTEGFIAAIGVSLFYDLLRLFGHASTGGEAKQSNLPGKAETAQGQRLGVVE